MIKHARRSRRLLQTVGAVAAASLAFPHSLSLGSAKKKAGSPQVDFSWINQVQGPRPEYVWENREDVFYHDLSFRDVKVRNAPEFVAFMMRPWVFNRAMEWHREGGCIVCYSVGGDLLLTGEKAASAWHSDAANWIEQAGEFTRFEKRSTSRRRDCAVVPSFQFHLGQHSRADLTVSEASDDWQFVVSIKGRAGAPLISSGWQKGKGSFTFDIAEALKARGFELNYPELHFVLGIWGKDAPSPSSVTFRLLKTALKSGVPILVAVLNERGERLGAEEVCVYTLMDGRRISLKEKNKLWKASVRGLKQGDYRVKLVSKGAVERTATARLRVTDGKFWSYDRPQHSFALDRIARGRCCKWSERMGFLGPSKTARRAHALLGGLDGKGTR
jgi:hypothetical protein